MTCFFTWAELLDQDEAMGGGIEDQHRDTEQRQRERRKKKNKQSTAY